MISRFKNNNFLTISFKNLSQVIIRVVIGILNIKILAVFLGPSGIVIVSQLQSFLQLTTNIAGAGISNGVIKYLSQYRSSPIRINLIISTGLFIILIASTLVGIVTFSCSGYISNILFQNTEYQVIIKSASIYIISTALFNIILAINNGLQNLKKYIGLNILYFVSSFIIILSSIYFFKLEGALWAIIFQSCTSLFFSLLFTFKKYRKLILSKLIVRRLTKFSLMALTSGIIAPLTVIIIRYVVINQLSIEDAGIWEGVNRISNSYIGLVTLPFSYYFLPVFTSIKHSNEIRKEITNSFKILIPILFIGGFTIYCIKDILIPIILSQDFYSISKILKWQIIGDIFHVLNWVYGILLIAKEKTLTFILTELLSAILIIVFTYQFIVWIQIEGTTLAYLTEKVLTFFILYFIYIKNWKKEV